MSENQGPSVFCGVKIVYFDDSKLFLSVIGKMLVELGAEFIGVDDPLTCIEVLSQQSPDLVITDLEMPGIDGITLVSKVRENESFNSIPIVVLTASDNPEIAMRAIAAGADDFVAKAELSRILAPKILALLRIRNNNLKVLRLKEFETATTMVATFKHEFNNTLMILDGKLSIHKRSLPDEFDISNVEKMRTTIDRMKNILKSLDSITEVKTEVYSGKSKILKLG